MRGGGEQSELRWLWRMLRWWGVFCALLPGALFPGSAAIAAQGTTAKTTPTLVSAPSPEETTAALRAELDDIYQRLLKDPSKRELNRQLIAIALELKDFDAAIGAVERLIFYEPENAELQLEAGRLYFKIDSLAAARGYLEAALALPGAAPQTRKEAMDLLGQITEKERPSPWGFFGQAGARYQSNANIGPPFLDPLTEPQLVEGPIEDWNVFGLGTLAYNRGVGDHLVLEGSLSEYYADQIKVDRLDLGFGEVKGGVRFKTKDGGFSVKPYGIAQGFLLGSDPYELAYGGGASARLVVAEGWWFEPQFEYKRRDYFNSEDYADAETQNGDFFVYAVNGSGQFSEDLSWLSRVAYTQNFATEIDINPAPNLVELSDYNGYEQYAADLSVRLGFDVFGWDGWALTPFAGAKLTGYNGIAPQEALGTRKVRQDFQWNAGATLEIPMGDTVGLAVQFQYTNNDSNISRYTYDNIQVTSGPTVRF